MTPGFFLNGTDVANAKAPSGVMLSTSPTVIAQLELVPLNPLSKTTLLKIAV
jgi:hypothetical protein